MGIHKNVEMDNLSKDSCEALKAGMSYGKYMAMKAPTKATTPPPAPAPTGYYHVCHYCGKEFYVPDKRHKKFCSDRCRELSYYVPKVKTSTKICKTCGKEFVTTKKQQKYCGEFCAKVGKSQKIREWRENAKEEKANG
jgi:endogenous inhibitor of DNA gyrase (YacG/DUF329 family)